jgi:hypothetical protein
MLACLFVCFCTETPQKKIWSCRLLCWFWPRNKMHGREWSSIITLWVTDNHLLHHGWQWLATIVPTVLFLNRKNCAGPNLCSRRLGFRMLQECIIQNLKHNLSTMFLLYVKRPMHWQYKKAHKSKIDLQQGVVRNIPSQKQSSLVFHLVCGGEWDKESCNIRVLHSEPPSCIPHPM